ncbi:MAG: hypothetical protein HQL53_02295 [Magnetococcales bacterium]|nr:hypothetical protein [Magnetococcales bacterium]
MERRIYFILGDILNLLCCGALGGYWAAALMVPSWSDLPSMALGMLLGMAASMVAGLIFTPLFGAMEVMLPGMLAGMLGGMLGAMTPAAAGDASWCGEAINGVGLGGWSGWEMGMMGGALVMLLTYLLQAHYEGRKA